MNIPILLQKALRDSITSGSFVDIKFWVFSKRGSNSGRVGGPKALFVNERVAKRVPRLGALLDECKNNENLRTRFPANRRDYTSNYDYEDDSDLEEDDDDDVPEDKPTAVPPQVAKEKLGNDSSQLIVIGNSDTKDMESSDMISASDADSLFSERPDTKDEIKPTHVGKVVIVEDVAFVTFQALLRYLYTNEIEFAPWGSTERRKARELEAVSESYGIPKPSPKSIYRLADKYDIPELKELAMQQIRQDLSKCNIAEEALSAYTSWYPELRELQIRQLARTLLSFDPGPTWESLKKKIKCYTQGQLPHGKHVFSVLYELMENDELEEETSLPMPGSPNPGVVGGDWAGLKKALASSLTSGTFLDSQFYAVESRSSTGPPKIRPVYFCSVVGGGFTSKLMACSSELEARKAPAQFADGYDSDIESGEPDKGRSTDRYPRSKCVREWSVPMGLPSDPALLLNYGAAKTWSAVFLYVYTGQVSFATISSLGFNSNEAQDNPPEDEPKSPQDRDGLGVLPPAALMSGPCSPKSIYRLAIKVGLAELCDIAFKDIQSKLDEENIIEELFSPFAADHENVREMEHELFHSKLKPSVDGALISHMIESSSSGKHPHHTAAMVLIFGRSIQERRKRMLAKAKNNTSQPDSASQPKGNDETSNVPVQQVQPPVPKPQPLSQPPGFFAKLLVGNVTKPEASSSYPAPSKPAKTTEVAQSEEPPIENKANQHSLEASVELVCMGCGFRQKRNSLGSGIYCITCPRSSSVMRCVGCGTDRAENVKTCTNCHKKFK